jgi:uncharacterized membrane protein
MPPSPQTQKSARKLVRAGSERALARRVAEIIALAAFATLATAGIAQAQSGGSMGGGDWGSHSSSPPSSSHNSYGTSSSSPSGSSSRTSSSRSSSNHSSEWSTGSSGGGGDVGVIIILSLIGVVAMTTLRALASDREATPRYFSMTSEPPTAWAQAEADVTVLRFALDARVRTFVQAELARIGKSADTATAEGRATMLREVALLLRRTRDAWVYGGAINPPMTSLDEAKRMFDQHVTDARGRFVHELVRNEQGVITTANTTSTVAGAEGPGLVVVTLVIAARSELFSVRSIGTGDDLRQALESASNRTANDLIAIEIIWMPADQREQLSSIAVEARYPAPDLVKLAGALVGKAICSYCAGPFPAELISCPHCGARAADTPSHGLRSM